MSSGFAQTNGEKLTLLILCSFSRTSRKLIKPKRVLLKPDNEKIIPSVLFLRERLLK